MEGCDCVTTPKRYESARLLNLILNHILVHLFLSLCPTLRQRTLAFACTRRWMPEWLQFCGALGRRPVADITPRANTCCAVTIVASDAASTLIGRVRRWCAFRRQRRSNTFVRSEAVFAVATF